MRQCTTPERNACVAPRTRSMPSAAAVTDKTRRHAALQRLAGEVRTVRATLESARARLLELMEVEQQRRLTTQETGKVRQLRWEYEHLRATLGALREEFEQVRAT